MTRSSSIHCHTAYALEIHSDLSLPGMLPGSGRRCDLEVRIGPIEHEREPIRVDQSHAFWANDGRACYLVDGVGAYLVRDGAEILVDPEEHADSDLIRLSLIGPALGLALIQRGIFALHGSTVAIGDQGISVMGGFAAGKSTLVAGLQRLGHCFVSDDLTAVSTDGESAWVIPGYPMLKLWPDAARSLGLFDDRLPRVHPEHDKRFVTIDQGFSSAKKSLQRMYLLAVGDNVAIEPLTPVESFDTIVANWYGGRFGPAFLDAVGAGELFLQAGRLAREVRVRRLVRPASLAHDPLLSEKIAAEIERDLAAD